MTPKQILVAYLQTTILALEMPPMQAVKIMAHVLATPDEKVPKDFFHAAAELVQYVERDDYTDQALRPSWLPVLEQHHLEQIERIGPGGPNHPK